MNVEINGPKILGYLFGNTNLPITETMRNSWIIMAFILFLCIFFLHRIISYYSGKNQQKTQNSHNKILVFHLKFSFQTPYIFKFSFSLSNIYYFAWLIAL